MTIMGAARFKKGVCAIDPESGKVGKVLKDPDGDDEVTLSDSL